MTAETKFENVLNYISKSKLNFSIYKTPFSAQISLKNSFAKYYGEIEDLAAATSEMEINEEETKPKSESTEIDEGSALKETEKLKTFIEDNLKVISELRSKNSELESKLKQANKESKKNRQKAEKYQKMLMIKKDESQDELEHSDEELCTNVETNNKFILLGDFAPLTEKNVNVNKEVQTETVCHVHDCFYCDETLQSSEEVNTHVKTCDGRPSANFTCEQCGLDGQS